MEAPTPSKEYDELDQKWHRVLVQEDPAEACSDALDPANREKNRYFNVIPLNETRVKLSDGEPGDYVNASWIKPSTAYAHKLAYISAQAPVRKAIADFWRMIWQESVFIIVMLTKTTEHGQIKADQYWPKQLNISERISANLEIELQEEDNSQLEIVIRRIILRHLGDGSERYIDGICVSY